MLPALLVVDVQVGILGGPPAIVDADGVVERVASLVERARAAGAPVVFIQHDGGPGERMASGTPGWAIDPRLTPASGEPIVHKRECDAFYQTELDALLRVRGVEALVVAGLMTQFCIDTTCRRAFSLGYHVTLAADAHGTGDTEGVTAKQIVAHHNASLHQFGSGAHGPHTILVRPAGAIVFE